MSATQVPVRQGRPATIRGNAIRFDAWRDVLGRRRADGSYPTGIVGPRILAADRLLLDFQKIPARACVIGVARGIMTGELTNITLAIVPKRRKASSNKILVGVAAAVDRFCASSAPQRWASSFEWVKNYKELRVTLTLDELAELEAWGAI